MESTTQTQAGPPPPPWQPPLPGMRPPLVRSRTDRKLAGVAGGLAAHLGVDPLWLRIGFVVLTFAGGLGILLYLIGWALIPEEGQQATFGDGLLERLRRAPSWVPIVLFVIAGLVFFGRAWGGPVFWALALIAAGVWLYRNDAHHQPPASPPFAGPPAGTMPPAPTVPSATDTPSVPGGGPAAAWPGSVPPHAYPPHPYAYAPPPVFAPRPRRPRSYLGRYTMAAMLLVLGVTAALDNIGAFRVPARAYPALALLVVGAGLVVGTFWGRSRSLILIGLLILPVAFAASLLRVPISGGAGQRVYVPATQAAVSPEYNLGAGQVRLDLTQVPWGPQPLTTRVRVAAGEIDVVVPADVTVDFRAHTGAGEIDLPEGRIRNGLDVTFREILTGDNASAQTPPRLVLDAEASVGQIRLIRNFAPAVIAPAAISPAAPAVTATAH